MQDLNITLVQSPLHWEQAEANMAMFEEKLWGMEAETDLILLPEMFNTGFTMDTSNWEHINGRSVNWMKQQASQFNAVISGSLIIKDDRNFYNRLVWARPDGSTSYYDKRHLFTMTREDEGFTGGGQRKIFEIKGWKIMPLICYDLRFPVWSRNRVDNKELEYDLLIYVANWPKPRINAWATLLKARAVENLSYVAGLNRVGEDGNGFEYNGHSALIDFKGEVVKDLAESESLITARLNYQELLDFRQKFPAWNDGDNFEISL